VAIIVIGAIIGLVCVVGAVAAVIVAVMSNR
jgi:hypothetical protein